jgi:alkaline phosphatase D
MTVPPRHDTLVAERVFTRLHDPCTSLQRSSLFQADCTLYIVSTAAAAGIGVFEKARVSILTVGPSCAYRSVLEPAVLSVATRASQIKHTLLGGHYMQLPVLLALPLVLVVLVQAADIVLDHSALRTLAYGSCSKPQFNQTHWSYIEKLHAQVFIWLGDIIYADLSLQGKWLQDSHNYMLQEYAAQKQQPEYRKHVLENGNITVLGIWDDHDFGKDNMGRHYPHKDLSKERLLDFLDESQQSPRWKRNGVFISYEYGSVQDNNLVKIILLDGRYFRDDCNFTDASASYLGEEQWKWLENELTRSKARVHIFVSGVQFVSDDRYQFSRDITGGKKFTESWGAFPYERERLLAMIETLKVPGALFLSGDIHFAELSVLECSRTGYPIYDLTSSSLTHSWRRVFGYVNFKEHPFVNLLNGIYVPVWKKQLSSLILYAMYWIAPRRFSEAFYSGNNFGIVEFDWEKEQIFLKIHDSFSGIVQFEKALNLSELVYSSSYLSKCSESALSKAALRSNQLAQQEWKLRLALVLSPFILAVLFLLVKTLRFIFCVCCKTKTAAKIKHE